MKTNKTVLTKEERETLILAALHPKGKRLSNSEIAQCLGVSVSRVKTLIRQACVKLGADSRHEAILFAARRGDIILTDFYTLDEIAEIIGSLGPDLLRRIADLVRQKLEHGHLSARYKKIIYMERRQDPVLTERERDVLILVGRGLTNKEIADKLYITISAVNTFVYRSCAKLGVHNRAEAVVSALKQKEINVAEIYSLNESLQLLFPLGADSVEKMAQTLDQKLGQ